MTWYGDYLYCEARDEVLAALAASWLKSAVHHVVEPLDHEWYTPGVEHGLPDGGLVAVRPVGEPGPSWYGTPVLSWRGYPRGDRPPAAVPPSRVKPALGEHKRFAPPAGYLAWARELAARTNTSVVCYYAFMWGGDTEYEYAWVFGKVEEVYVDGPDGLRVFAPDGEAKRPGDVLVEALRPLGLQLPSPYFALHTREFDWKPYAVGPAP